MPRFPLVGKTPSKVSNIYICVLGIHENLYAHIKGEFSLLIELGEFIHTLCLVYKVDLKTFITPKFSVVINYQKGGD